MNFNASTPTTAALTRLLTVGALGAAAALAARLRFLKRLKHHHGRQRVAADRRR